MIVELLIFAFVVASDLVSKALLAPFLQETGSYVIIDKIFTFIYSENTGASFGIFAGNKFLLIGLTCVVCVLLAAFLLWQRKSPKFFRISLILILGGAIGNLYDRIFLGYVRDFIDYTFLDTFFGIDFAIGNIADIYLCVGVLMMIVYVIFVFKEDDFTFIKKKSKELTK